MPRRIASVAVLAALVLATAVLQAREVRRAGRERTGSGLLEKHSTAPELVGPVPRGGEFRLSSLKGKVVVVSFWASWCLPCRVEMPELAEFTETWNADAARTKDLVYVAVNVKDEPGVVNLLAKDQRFKKVQFALDSDGKLAERWRVEAFPTTYLISPDGTILDAVRGYQDGLGYRLRMGLRPYRSDVAGNGAGS